MSHTAVPRYHGNGLRVTMRWVRRLMWCAVILTAGSAATAQDQSTSAPARAPAAAAADPTAQSPASLERIRSLLKKDPESLLLRQADIPTLYKIQIIEQQKLDDLLSKIDVGKPGPIPAGGVRMWEEQRRLFNPIDRPLAQPYAAFSTNELITLGVEGLLGRYMAAPALKKLGDTWRGSRENAAKDEVDTAIADFCAKRPDRNDIYLCTSTR
jgi:hypothetical protein